MPKKHFSTEQIIMKLREIEVLTSQSETLDQAKKLKDLEKENAKSRLFEVP